MKTLLIDAGNSNIKWALLDGEVLSGQSSLSYGNQSPLKLFEKTLNVCNGVCDGLIMVTVLGEAFSQKAQQIATQKKLNYRQIKSISELAGIKNAYPEVHKLGADRFVAMIAAYHLSNIKTKQKQACIIVDSGTATTIDAVDQNGQHLGGVILQGLRLCTDSLLDNTELLPLWNEQSSEFEADFFSKETTQAIASGCLIGLAGAIDSICLKMEEEIQKNMDSKNATVKKILCGGGARKLLLHLQSDYQLQDNLLMIGLKVIKEADRLYD